MSVKELSIAMRAQTGECLFTAAEACRPPPRLDPPAPPALTPNGLINPNGFEEVSTQFTPAFQGFEKRQVRVVLNTKG